MRLRSLKSQIRGSLLFLIFLLVGVSGILGVIVGVFILLFGWPHNDTDHPDFDRYAQRFEEIAAALDASDPQPNSLVIDFAPLNKGDWEVACIFGGYTYPSEYLQKRGVAISEEASARLHVGPAIVFGDVAESAVLIAYVDGTDRVHSIRFRNGLGPAGQHLEQCISKPETVFRLPQ